MFLASIQYFKCSLFLAKASSERLKAPALILAMVSGLRLTPKGVRKKSKKIIFFFIFFLPQLKKKIVYRV